MSSADTNTLMRVRSLGANMGAEKILERRMEERVAQAALVDLYREGLIVVRRCDWEAYYEMVRAMRGALRIHDDA